MTLKVAEYRKHAADCRAMASHAKDEEKRKMLQEMASAWENLAIERKKFLELNRALGHDLEEAEADAG